MFSLRFICGFFRVYLRLLYQDGFKVLFGFHLGSKEAKEQELGQQKHITEGKT